MVTELTPASLLDPHDPAAFLEAQQAHMNAANALLESELALSDRKCAIGAIKHDLAIREAQLITDGLNGKNKDERDAALELKKASDQGYRELGMDLMVAEQQAAAAAAEVSRLTAEVSNAKARMAFITAWLTAEAARREAL